MILIVDGLMCISYESIIIPYPHLCTELLNRWQYVAMANGSYCGYDVEFKSNCFVPLSPLDYIISACPPAQCLRASTRERQID